MHKLVSVLVLLAFAVACGQQAEEVASDEAAAPTVSTEADVEAIAAVQDQEVEVFLSGDANLSHLADNAVLMPPNEPAVVGIEAARAWATEFFDQFTVNVLDYKDKHIVVAGDVAIEQYAGSWTFAPNDGGDPTSLTFKGTHVYERQTDGSWKMALDIWNYDGAPVEE
jgi:ketosteroid isomerase-like protein